MALKRWGRDAIPGLIERDYRDVRLDYADHYFVLFPGGGQSLIAQNDQATRLRVGDVALVDTTRPVKFYHSRGPWSNSAINLLRRELVVHLGFEPEVASMRPDGTRASRLLLELSQTANEESRTESVSANSYMQLVVYDLVGALFAPSDQSGAWRHADASGALSRRAMPTRTSVLPRWRPRQEFSLRYLHKLFTQRGATCTELIYSLRLDHAARLLSHRESLRNAQPLSKIAYACGFRDYTHFARTFRSRFGYPPGAHSAEDGRAVTLPVRSDADELTLSAHDPE